MKKRKMNQILAFLLSFVLFIGGCGINSTTVYAGTKKTVAPKKIVLNSKKETTAVGCSLTLKVQSVKPISASKKVTWSSSNTKVATVNKKGIVKAKKTGTVVITAKSTENKKAVAKCKIRVYKATKKMKLVSEKAYTMNQGEKLILKAKVMSPAKGYEPVKWSSKNPKIAKISKKGNVTAVSEGTTIVTGQSGKKKVKVRITVRGTQEEQKPDTKKTEDSDTKKTEDNSGQNNSNIPEQGNIKKDDISQEKPSTDVTDPNHPDNSDDPKVYTRAKWISDLVAIMGYEDSDSINDTVFYDLDECEQAHEIYLAASKGVFSLELDEGNEFNPQDVVTREFAAMTAINALGFDNKDILNTSDAEQLSFPQQDSFFVKKGIVTLIDGAFMPNQELSPEEREKALQFIKNEIESRKNIEEKYDVVYTENVVENIAQIEETEIDVEQGGFLIPANEETKALIPGNIIFIPYIDTALNNIPLKIAETQEQGDKILVKGTVAEFDEVFSSVDIAGNIDSIYSVSSNDIGEIEQENAVSDNNLQADTGWDLGGSIPLREKTKLEKTIGDESLGGKISGCIDHIEYKLSVTGTQVDIISVNVISDFTIEGSLKQEIGEGEIGLGIAWSIPIEINKVPTGFSFEIVPKLYIEAEGSVSIKFEVQPQIGFTYTNENGISYNKEIPVPEKTVEGKISVGAGIKLQCDLAWGEAARRKIQELFGVQREYKAVYDTALKFGIYLDRTNEYNDGICVDYKLKPRLILEIGQNSIVVDSIKKLFEEDDEPDFIDDISKKIDIFELLNKDFTLLCLHLENGKIVDQCKVLWNGLKSIIDEDGKLTISGKYKKDDKASTTPPWWKDRDKIKSVEVQATNIESMAAWFKECNNLESFTIGNKNATKYVENMSELFSGCDNLNSVDLSNCDTRRVTDMSYMFNDCVNLSNLDVSSLDTSKVTDMGHMFAGCSKLDGLDASGFDTGNVTNMHAMFWNCSSMGSLDIGKWDTSSVANMQALFSKCEKLENLDVSRWDTSSVTNMRYMFYGCEGLESLDISNFDTGNVTEMYSMFEGCKGLRNLDISKWDTGNVTTMHYLFRKCSGLESMNMTGLDTSKVTDMIAVFEYCSNIESVNLNNLDTSNVTGMEYLFNGCSKLTDLNINGIDTGNVTSMSHMFYRCENLTEVDLSNLDISKVTSMYQMFDSCKNLKKVDLSGLNADKLENTWAMFFECTHLEEADLTGFKANNITDAEYMFFACNRLQELDLSGFDWSKTALAFTLDCGGLKSIKIPLKGGGCMLIGTFKDEEGNIYTTLPKEASESFVITRVTE